MPPELFFKLSFVLLFVSAVAIRVHNQRLAGTSVLESAIARIAGAHRRCCRCRTQETRRIETYPAHRQILVVPALLVRIQPAFRRYDRVRL
jgi:hypothetical protein